jgi:hypothetical protein
MEFIKNNYLVQYILIIIVIFISINLINNYTCEITNKNIIILENYK